MLRRLLSWSFDCCLGTLWVVAAGSAREMSASWCHRTMNSILQLVDSLRPDELIWLHAYMTGRGHALMPATHLQMSGRPVSTPSSVPEAAASVSSERSTPPRGLGMAYLTPTCGATCSACGRRACQGDDSPCMMITCALPVSSKPCASSKSLWSLRVNLVAYACQPYKGGCLCWVDTVFPILVAL